MRRTVTGLTLLLLASPAAATDLVFGFGSTVDSGPGNSESSIVQLELHSDPIWHLGRVDLAVAGAIDLHDNGEYWAGGGLAALWPMRKRWFIEASVMPGYFGGFGAQADLGSHFEIRSLLGIGRQINDRVAVSLAVTHKSNASTADRNPGVNMLELRTRWSF